MNIKFFTITLLSINFTLTAQDFVPNTGGTFNGKIEVNSSYGVTARGNATNQMFFVGERTGSTNFRIYDNRSNIYYDTKSNMTFRANLLGGTNGSINLIGGKVGVGTQEPTEDLTVFQNHARLSITGNSGTSAILLGNRDSHGTNNPAAIYAANGHLYLGGGNSWNRGGTLVSTLAIIDNGTVGIGTNDTKGYKLGVNGKIAATEVKVAQYGNWPDYVFTSNYQLPTLQEVAQFIKLQGHLPNIPSAEEVASNEGIELGEMNRLLLQKIEELTLYTIEQEKKLEQQAIEVEKIEELTSYTQAQEKKLKQQALELQKMKQLELRLAKLETILLEQTK